MALPCSRRTERISSEANGRESCVTMSGEKKKRVKSSSRNKLKSFFFAGRKTKYKIKRSFEENKNPDEPSYRIDNS